MSETTDYLLKEFYKTVTLNIDGKELPFKIRKLSVLELSSKTSIIGSLISGGAKKLEDADNAAIIECVAWAIDAACVDPVFSSKGEEGKLPLATLPAENAVELAMEIFKHCGLIDGMQEAKKVRPFSAGAAKAASSRQT